MTYDRDEVRRLEREIEDTGNNAYRRADFEPRGVCKKHVGLHSDIEGLCEDWRLEREFDLWCQKNDLWPTDENYKIWKESPSASILQMICKHGNNVCIQCYEEEKRSGTK